MPGVGPQTTSNLTSTTHIEYVERYVESAMRKRLYDQLAKTVDDNERQHKASTLTTPYLSSMSVRRAAISQTADVTPQILREGTTTLSPDLYGDVVQIGLKARILSYANYRERMIEVVGINNMMILESLAIDAALAGSLVYRGAARASIDAGTTGHNMTSDVFAAVANTFQSFNTKGWGAGGKPSWACITDPFVVHDLVTTADVLNVAQYQLSEIILNDEVGRLNAFKIVSSGQAKMFIDAGIDNASAVATTLDGAVNAMATSVVVAANTNIVVGDWLNFVETEETAGTFYPLNERVRVASIATTTIGVVGQADNGGLLYDHASGLTIANADTVHTALFGGPESLSKTWAPEIGEFGEVLTPEEGGSLKQWETVGSRWWGAYARNAEKNLYRAEVSVIEEA